MENAGVKVISFDLPGHGDDKTEIGEVSFAGYVQKVKAEIAKLSTPITLVGHSLAGFVISQVAEEMPEKIEKLVFIATMIPHLGKSVFEIIKEDNQSKLLQNLVFSDDQSWVTVNMEALKEVVYNGATIEQINAAAPKLVRQATQPFFAVVSTSENAFGKIEKTFIVCEHDKILSPNAQRNMSKAVGISKAFTISTGHVPQIENPEELAKLILKA
ncbi:alpha/beta hydrolase [Muricauda sp. CAU 1633]|nr:alpha/beta hydrolase [Muricauda sp. CAU 1633]